MIQAIFFDAVGTLFYLNGTVGHHYAQVGKQVGLTLDAQQLDDAFHLAWKKMPRRAAIAGPRENDDKDWWRELVDLVLAQVSPSLSDSIGIIFLKSLTNILRSPMFGPYPAGFLLVLQQLQPRFQLAVISNFDGRLRLILQHLGISAFYAYFHFQRNRSGQTGSRDLSARLKVNRFETKRGASCWRRSRTGLESCHSGWFVGLSIGAT